jgi:hypothetical protein
MLRLFYISALVPTFNGSQESGRSGTRNALFRRVINAAGESADPPGDSQIACGKVHVA